MTGGLFERFDDRAKRVLALAQDEAAGFKHNYIGTEHLLLGLLRLEKGIAREALERLGVDFAQVHRAVGFIVGGGEVSPTEQVLSPRTKRVIELAEDEAQAAGSRRVGDEHLLLGLVREGEGMASGILLSLGVALERIREELLKRRGGDG